MRWGARAAGVAGWLFGFSFLTGRDEPNTYEQHIAKPFRGWFRPGCWLFLVHEGSEVAPQEMFNLPTCQTLDIRWNLKGLA